MPDDLRHSPHPEDEFQGDPSKPPMEETTGDTAGDTADRAEAGASADSLEAPTTGGTTLDAAPVIHDETRPMRTPRRTTLGPFRLEEKIGEGGMGVVYRAHDPQLRRWVAIKRIHSRYEKDGAYNRLFLAEARAVAAVSHPNIAQIFSIHPGEGDEPSFFAMEYIEGLSTEARVRRDGPLAPEAVVEIGIQAARGLRAAYRNGIVHRDVKPSNLLLDDRNQVKLVDFGLAIQVGEMSSDENDDDRILCTPHYVSPEQARGWRVDHRSDIYSLGCTLYFLLTGREPFHRENRVDLFVAHANESAPAPSTLDSATPSIPASLDAVILCMLEKRPEDRPLDYDVLMANFDAILAEISPRSSKARPWSGWRIAASLVVVAAATTAGLMAATREPREPPFLIEEYFGPIYIPDRPYEKLHYDFTAPDAAARLSNRFSSYEVDIDRSSTVRPVVQNGALVWKNYDRPIRLPYLSEFREIELRGLLFLKEQHFRLRIGDDGTYGNQDGIDITLAVGGDPAHDRVVTSTRHGEFQEIATIPSRLDFRVKEEEYILRLVCEDDPEAGWASFQFTLDQELEQDEGRTSVLAASFRFRLPKDQIPRGGIVLSSEWPAENQNTVKIKEILIRGIIDRDRLALEQRMGTL